MRERCPCGDPDCWWFAAGYLYCWGCGEHHREPVGEHPGVLCPVGRDATDDD